MNVRWKIRGYEGLTMTFEIEAIMSETRVKDTLRLLAARYLTEREVIEARSNGTSDTRLDVRLDRGGNVPSLSIGDDFWFTAIRAPKRQKT